MTKIRFCKWSEDDIYTTELVFRQKLPNAREQWSSWVFNKNSVLQWSGQCAFIWRKRSKCLEQATVYTWNNEENVKCLQNCHPSMGKVPWNKEFLTMFSEIAEDIYCIQSFVKGNSRKGIVIYFKYCSHSTLLFINAYQGATLLSPIALRSTCMEISVTLFFKGWRVIELLSWVEISSECPSTSAEMSS